MSHPIGEYICDAVGRAVLIGIVVVFVAGFAVGAIVAVVIMRTAAPAAPVVQTEGRAQ